ncbi:MAG TPA: patatin-like phospholipase family protein [Planktothrix sp.]|jgi:NTE family protein
MTSKPFTASSLDQPVDCVLGGGGVKGLAHVGFLRALDERNVKTADVYGASIGAIIATFFTNGHPLTTMEETTLAELKHFGKDTLIRAFKRPRVKRLGLVELRPIFEAMVKRHNLKPQPNLKIVACYRDGLKLRPIVFQGTDYDLVTALTASCAIPPFMRAQEFEVEGEKRWLLDGGIYHAQPHEFCQRPALISKLGLADQLPAQPLSPVDWAIHLSEMSASRFKEKLTSKPGLEHCIITTGDRRVATMTFDLPDERLQQMVKLGHKRTVQALSDLSSTHSHDAKEPAKCGRKK